MNSTELYAEEVAALLKGMAKGAYMVLCAALAKAGGEIVIGVNELEVDALRPSPRVEVSADERGVVIKKL